MNRKVLILLAIAGIVIATFAVYANSFGNEFLFDDISQIVENAAIRSFKNLPAIFTHHLTYFSEEHQQEGKFYRPIQTLTLMTDHFLWGMEPFGYHLTNTSLHAIVAVLFFVFALLLTGSIPMSFIIGILYAVHPLHTEAVTYMSGRADSLCAIALLLMVIFQRKYWASEKPPARVFYYILISASFILGLLSKELTIVFPFLLMVCEYCLRSDKGYSSLKKRLLFYLPLFLIMGVWFVVKNKIVITETMVTHPTSLATRLTTAPRLIMDYIRLSFIPTDLHMEYKMPFPRTAFQKGYFEGIIFTLVLIAAWWYSWRRGKTDRGYRVIFFGLTWFFVGLLPYLNLIFQLNAPFAEHWLYIPEMGFIISVIYAVFIFTESNLSARRAVISICLAAALAYSFMTVKQNTVWKDPFTFYTYTMKYAPYSATTYNNLAIQYIKRGELLEAEKYFQKALQVDPDYELAKQNLDKLALDMKNRGIR